MPPIVSWPIMVLGPMISTFVTRGTGEKGIRGDPQPWCDDAAEVLMDFVTAQKVVAVPVHDTRIGMVPRMGGGSTDDNDHLDFLWIGIAQGRWTCLRTNASRSGLVKIGHLHQ